eukprot:GHVO01033138.1.p1 GENE.GHVO01033138.1~~GHVO01033138.1.p1  ORF type:complete len:258 (+),score=21.33 GHVO01033138.1:340-1113(+)
MYFNDWNADDIIEVFESFETDIVIGAEAVIFPSADLQKSLQGDERWNDAYPNSGFIIGRVGTIRNMMSWAKEALESSDYMSDQHSVVTWYWLNRNDTSVVKMDYFRKLVTNLSYTYLTPQLPGVPDSEFKPLWYYTEYCKIAGSTDVPSKVKKYRWYHANGGWMSSDKIFYNRELYTQWRHYDLDCSELFEVQGCRVSQRLLSPYKFKITPEQNLEIIEKGPWADALPKQESWAYHGNGRSKLTLKPIIERVKAQCE